MRVFVSIAMLSLCLNAFRTRTLLKKSCLSSRSRHTMLMSTYVETDRVDLKVSSSTGMEFSGDLLIVPFYKPSAKKEDDVKIALKAAVPLGLSSAIKDIAMDLIERGEFTGDAMSKQVARIAGSVRQVALVGLGPNPRKEGEAMDIEVTSASRIGKMIATISRDTKSQSVGLAFPFAINNAGITQCLLGLHDVAYTDNRYRKVPEGGHKPFPLQSVAFLGLSSAVSESTPLVARLSDPIAAGVALAKDLVGSPPNYMTPVVMADVARKLAADLGLEVVVYGQEECEARGMGAYLGVQQGSRYPPQFVHMTYRPTGGSNGDTVKVALVGKGLTFDSGGYNLKAGAGSMIEMMKFDMGGAAAVLGCARAIGLLRPKNVEVHFISAMCENMVSAEAMRPGDILVASNGKTIEVLNTDAEGRLTLADALVYAEGLGAEVVVDLATLTGAAIVGLGEKVAALYSPDQQLRSDLEAAAKRTDEGLWAMPLEPAYKDLIKSTQADLKNIGGKGGGSITAALFLQEFVDKARWAHIDMAGPVWDTAGNKPTGYGVKLLVDFLLTLRK